MSVQKQFEDKLKHFSREAALSNKSVVGNDLTFFGKNLNDPRLQLAFSLGWLLTKNTYEGVDYYDLLPPPHYEAARNSWAAVYSKVKYDEISISFPSWYFNDHVLMTGSHGP